MPPRWRFRFARRKFRPVASSLSVAHSPQRRKSPFWNPGGRPRFPISWVANKSCGVPRTAEGLCYRSEREAKGRERKEDEKELKRRGKRSRRRRLRGRRGSWRRGVLSARAQGQVHGAPSSRLKEPKRERRVESRTAMVVAGSGALPA